MRERFTDQIFKASYKNNELQNKRIRNDEKIRFCYYSVIEFESYNQIYSEVPISPSHSKPSLIL